MLCVCTIYMIVLTEERTMSDPLELQLWSVVSHPMLVVLGSSTRATLTVHAHLCRSTHEPPCTCGSQDTLQNRFSPHCGSLGINSGGRLAG